MKYRVRMMESERGWGQSYFDVDFDTFEAAEAYLAEVNQHNADQWARERRTPDYYAQPVDGTIMCIKNPNRSTNLQWME